MRNIKVLLQYDGTNYHGFQRQTDHLPTIQQAVEDALESLTKEKIIINGAGRTDAGVHAMGQVFNFKSHCQIPVERFPLAMNRLLPPDIVVLRAEDVDTDFHARFHAKGKLYRYHIYNARIPSAFDRRYSFYVPQKLDIDKMRQAAGYIVGEHDFSAFKNAAGKTRTSVRNIFSLEIEDCLPHLFISVEGSGFLYNMVRIITGTLIYVGKGKLAPENVQAFLEEGNRNDAGPTVPAQGLCMMRVDY